MKLMIKNWILPICIVGILTCFLSCRSAKEIAGLSSISGEWNIIEMNGAVVVPSPGQPFPFITFDTATGKVSGSTGCNNFMGSFDINAGPGNINLGQVATTRMFCPDMTIEKNTLAAFAQVRKYRKSGEQIALCNASNRPVLILQRKAASSPKNTLASLTGKWYISEVSGQTLPEGMDRRPFMEFDVKQMRMHGNTSCNTVNGGIAVDSSNPSAFTFSGVASTMMACPDMSVEDKIVNALDKVKSFATEDGKLIFYDGGSSPVLTLVRN